jgi:hypothetical protein
MKFTTTTTTLSVALLASTLVSALPINESPAAKSAAVASASVAASTVSASASATQVAQKNGNKNGNKNNGQCSVKGNNNKNKVLGAAYFITNEPNGNNVVASRIGNDGKLTFASITATGGNGAHGDNGDNFDPLFTQDSVKVGGNHLFTVNTGSNTVSMFEINNQDPTKLKLIGQPADTNGEFPVAVAFNDKTDQVCVLNGGAVNGVSCFLADKKEGLIPVDGTTRSLGLNQTTPANGPAGTVSDLLFSEDGSKLHASVKGIPPTPGFIATWNVSCTDGSLSEDFKKSTPGKGGALPFSMTLIPGKDAVLATDAAIGFSTFDFSKTEENAPSQIIEVKDQKAVCWSSLSSKTGTFFMTDIGTSTVTEAVVNDDLSAKIVKQYPLAVNSSTIDNAIATINNKDFLYVLAPAAEVPSINVMAVGNAPGQAKLIQTFQVANDVKKAKGVINGKNLQGMAVFFRK